MRLWTFQGRAVLEALREHGRLEVDLRHKGLEQAPRAYRWLALEMRARIPGHQGGLPWWLHVGPVLTVGGGPTCNHHGSPP